jgi:hypothetical protein
LTTGGAGVGGLGSLNFARTERREADALGDTPKRRTR